MSISQLLTLQSAIEYSAATPSVGFADTSPNGGGKGAVIVGSRLTGVGTFHRSSVAAGLGKSWDFRVESEDIGILTLNS